MARAFKNKAEAMEYLNTLPISTVLDIAADLLVERAVPRKISITEEQFRTMFKITGVREDGTVENRGRKRQKNDPELEGIFND